MSNEYVGVECGVWQTLAANVNQTPHKQHGLWHIRYSMRWFISIFCLYLLWIMNMIEFESAREKERIRQELREVRAEILKRVKYVHWNWSRISIRHSNQLASFLICRRNKRQRNAMNAPKKRKRRMIGCYHPFQVALTNCPAALSRKQKRKSRKNRKKWRRRKRARRKRRSDHRRTVHRTRNEYRRRKKRRRSSVRQAARRRRLTVTATVDGLRKAAPHSRRQVQNHQWSPQSRWCATTGWAACRCPHSPKTIWIRHRRRKNAEDWTPTIRRKVHWNWIRIGRMVRMACRHSGSRPMIRMMNAVVGDNRLAHRGEIRRGNLLAGEKMVAAVMCHTAGRGHGLVHRAVTNATVAIEGVPHRHRRAVDPGHPSDASPVQRQTLRVCWPIRSWTTWRPAKSKPKSVATLNWPSSWNRNWSRHDRREKRKKTKHGTRVATMATMCCWHWRTARASHDHCRIPSRNYGADVPDANRRNRMWRRMWMVNAFGTLPMMTNMISSKWWVIIPEPHSYISCSYWITDPALWFSVSTWEILQRRRSGHGVCVDCRPPQESQRRSRRPIHRQGKQTGGRRGTRPTWTWTRHRRTPGDGQNARGMRQVHRIRADEETFNCGDGHARVCIAAMARRPADRSLCHHATLACVLRHAAGRRSLVRDGWVYARAKSNVLAATQGCDLFRDGAIFEQTATYADTLHTEPEIRAGTVLFQESHSGVRGRMVHE